MSNIRSALERMGDFPARNTTPPSLKDAVNRYFDDILPREDDADATITALEAFDGIIDRYEGYLETLQVSAECAQVRDQISRDLWRHAGKTVSLESYQDQLTGDDLVVSVEGLLGQWVETRNKIMHRITKGLIDDARIAGRKRAVKAMREKADAYDKALRSIEAKDVSVKGVAKQLCVNGQLPNRLSQATSSDIRGLREIFERYLPKAISFSKHTHTSFAKITSLSKPDVIKELDEMAGQTHPATLFSKSLLDGSRLAGNRRVVFSIKDNEDTVGKIQAMARAKPPRIKGLKDTEVPKDTTRKIDRSEAQALVKALREYADVMDKANEALPKLLRELDYSRGFTQRGNRQNRRVGHRGIRQMRALANRSTLQAAQIVPDGFNHIRQHAKAIIQVLDRAMGNAKKATDEDDAE